jgi:hypothetical protein
MLTLLAVVLQKAFVWVQQLLSAQRTTYEEVIVVLERQGFGLTGLIQVITFLYRTARPFVTQMYAKHS